MDPQGTCNRCREVQLAIRVGREPRHSALPLGAREASGRQPPGRRWAARESALGQTTEEGDASAAPCWVSPVGGSFRA